MTTTTEAKKDQGLQVRTGIKAGGLAHQPATSPPSGSAPASKPAASR